MAGSDIFISYRRSDSAGHARALHKDLCRRFDIERIFFDRQSIESGELFTSRLDDEARQCKAFLALIGPDWLDAKDVTGARRLDVPEDCVRREVALVLGLGKKIVPVLFDDAPMPAAERLPRDLRGQASYDALTLRGKSTDYDANLELLVRLLGAVPGIPEPRPLVEDPGRRFFRVAEDLLSDYFTGRDAELATLARALPLTKGATPAAPLAIHGIAGCGKTQLALKLALDRQDDYAGIWWFRAERSDLLEADFESLCSECEVHRDTPEKPLGDAIRWLGLQRSSLLVFDNADSPEQVRPYLKEFKQRRELAKHHLLITSRNPNWAGIATPLEVRVWTLEQGTAFLASRLPGEERQEMRVLVERLGAHPLALEQAAAYIGETRMSLAAYLDLWGSVDIARGLLDKGQPITGYQRTLATTLCPSVERLSFAGLDLLRWCAGMSADPIPLALFTEHLELLPMALAHSAVEPLAWNETMGELWRFSLASRVRFSSRARTLDGLQLHRLTQEASSALLGQPEDAKIHLATLVAALPKDSEDPKTWPLGLALLPHLLHVLQVGQSSTGEHADAGLAVEGLNRATLLTVNAGIPGEATGLAEMAQRIAEACLDAEDPARCTTLSNLAGTLWGKGDFDRARALQEQALNLQRQALGDDHPDTLTSMLDFAEMLAAEGSFSEALRFEEHVIKMRAEALGVEHPDTLVAGNNLAQTLVGQDRLREAMVLHEELLEVRRRVLGRDHRSTLVTMNNLAETLRRLGDLAGARVLHEQAVDSNRRIQGAEHRNTLISMTNLALTLQHQGDLAAARDFFSQVLEVNCRARGAEHPETTRSASDLYVNLRWHLNDPLSAEEVFRKHLAWLLDAESGSLSNYQRYVRESLLEWAQGTGER